VTKYQSQRRAWGCPSILVSSPLPAFVLIYTGLRPNPFDVLEEATLNAAIAVISSIKATNELKAFMATQAVIAGFSGLRMMELSQRHLGEENIAVYGGYANKLIKLQNDLLQTLDRRRRGNSQSIVVKHPNRFSRSRVDLARRSSRVTTNTSPVARIAMSRANCLRSDGAPLIVS
jgi:hypothetical protein